MKVSNNALNFLLAQYRAIFKRAYVKGLASAVLLTAGLAAGAGQAQADDLTDSTIAKSQIAVEDSKITIGTASDTYENIQISGTASALPAWNADVTISSGVHSDNWIQASGGNVNLSGNGSLTISTSDADHGLAISGGTSSSDPYTTTVDIDSISITKGTLAIADGQSGSVTVAANTITIGNSETAVDNDATLTLSNLKNKGATLGHEKSEITVNGYGKLEVTASGTTTLIQGSKLALNDGAFMLVKNVSSQTGTLEIKSDDFTIDTDAVHVISGDAAITTKFTGTTGVVKGNLFVDQNGVFDISTKEGKGTVTLASGSNTVVSGSINVNDGTLNVKDGAILQASKDGATINVNANSSADPKTAGTLQISKAKLDAYLKGGADNQYHKITAADGTVAEALTDGASGAVMLSGGRLELTGDKNIDIAKTFKFSGTATAQAGTINLNTSAQSTVYAKNMTLSSKVTKDLATGDAGVSSALVIEAETLTLGANDLASGDESPFGFSGAKAQNLVLLAEDGNLNLQDQVTLSAVDVTTNDNETVVVGEKGKINGSFTISNDKSFTIEHGSYTNDGNITVSGGTLKVTNSGIGEAGSQQYVDTRWKVTGDLTLQAATNSTVVVDGADTDEQDVETVLDITDAKLNIGNAASADVEVDVQSGGTLILTGTQLSDLLHNFSTEQTNKSGSKVLLNDGLILVDGDVSLAATQLSGSNTANLHKLSFHTTNGGTLEVKGELELTDVNSLSLGGDSGAIVANILNLNNGENAASLTSGT